MSGRTGSGWWAANAILGASVAPHETKGYFTTPIQSGSDFRLSILDADAVFGPCRSVRSMKWGCRCQPGLISWTRKESLASRPWLKVKRLSVACKV